MAILSPNPDKPHPIDYTIGEENGTSEAFVGFMTYLIAKRFLRHNECVVMDNASIHSVSYTLLTLPKKSEAKS